MSRSSGDGDELPVFSEDSSSSSSKHDREDHGAGDHESPENVTVQNLEEILKKPDAIMEQDILFTMGKYIKEHGGSPHKAAQTAIACLTDGYVGYAQMGSLLCKWLQFIEEDDEDGTEEGHGDMGHGNREKKRAKKSPSCADSANENVFCSTEEEEIPDEATFLRQLAFQKFKPSIFANIFSTGGSGRPSWLNSLIADPDGRKLIYDLSHRHEDCLLLSFAIKSIVMQPGREEEVARQGVDLSRYFGVFHRILMVRLQSIAVSNDEEEIRTICRLIEHSAYSSLIGYLHVRQVLTILAASPHPWSSRFKRMYQDLEIVSKDGMAFKISRFFSSDDTVAFTASSYVAEVLAKASGGSVAPTSDVIKLYKMYLSDDHHDVPSVALLHHPMIVTVLLRSLFNPSKRLNGEALEAHVFVLAVAVSGLDSKETILKEQPGLVQMLQAIHTAVSLGHKATEDIVLSLEEKQQAKSSMQEVCCATGILMLLRKKLTSAEYWSAAYHVHKEPPFLDLLFIINDTHPLLHSDVFSLIKDALQAAGNMCQSVDILIGLVRVLVDLCKTQYIDEILPWVLQWARNANSEVSREFIFEILAIASPPYSKEFAKTLVQLMAIANVRRQSMGARPWASRLGLIREFYSSVQQMQQSISFDKAENSYLRDLKLTLSK